MISGVFLVLATAVNCTFTGPLAQKMAKFCEARVFGPDAKGAVYEEAVNAFRTHDDDSREDQRGVDPDKRCGLWQGEYWGKTMLSSALVTEYYGNETHKAWLRERALAFVREFQDGDGYLATYADRNFVGGRKKDWKFGAEVFCWNLWGRKYTMWALIELARVTDSPDLLKAAARMMDQEIAQLKASGTDLCDTGYFAGLASMSVLKPLILLYRATGDARYRAFAAEIVAMWRRDGNPVPNLLVNAFGPKPVHEWYPKPEWWAKAYEMMSCLEGLVAYSEQEGDAKVLEAVVRIVEKLEKYELSVIGCVGGYDHFEFARANPNAIAEVCDVVHWIRLNRFLFLATGDSHYLNNLEYAFYNAFLAGIYRDGKWGAAGVRSHGTRHYTAPREVGMRFHECCIDNAPRTFVDIADTTVTVLEDKTVSVNLYHDARIATDGMKIEIRGGYPVGNLVRVSVAADRPGRMRFRIPACFDRVLVDGIVAWGGWYTVECPAGKTVYALEFVRTPRLVGSTADPNVKVGERFFEFLKHTPEMAGYERKEGASHLVYGPLLLCKAKAVGASRDEIFPAGTVNRRGFSCSLKPLDVKGVQGAWRAELTNSQETFSVNVCDFASAADSDDSGNLFSIWF